MFFFSSFFLGKFDAKICTVLINISELFDAQKLKNLLEENSNLSSEDKKRLKIAFAEGYLAGHNIKSPGTKSVCRTRSRTGSVNEVFVFHANELF